MSGSSGPHAWRGPCPFALLLLLLLGPSSVLTISFHLPVNSRKCLREEIHKDLLVTGAYEITDQSGGAGGLRTHLKVRRGVGRGGETAGAGEVAEDRGVGRAEAGGLAWPRGEPRARRRDRPLTPLVGGRGAGLGTAHRSREPFRGPARALTLGSCQGPVPVLVLGTLNW